jgi:hypothetical protein
MPRTRPFLRTKQKVSISGVSQREAERLRNELQTAPAATKPDELIVQNASSAALVAHNHVAGDITDFNTASDARITAATGVSVQAYAANLTAWAALATASKQAAITVNTGWTAPTGTATKTGFATTTVTTEELAEHVKALIDALTAQGLLST